MNIQSHLPLLVDLMLKSTAVLALALLAAHLGRRVSAANRHVVWVAAFGVLLALAVVPMLSGGGREKPADAVAAVVLRLPAAAEPAAPVSEVRDGEEVAPVLAGRGLPDWRALSAGVWLGGIGLLVTVRLAGSARLFWLGWRSERVRSGRLEEWCGRLALENGIRRPVGLRVSKACGVALTWGTWRPVVLLPEEASAWDDARLERVLRHELAHVKRMDCLARQATQAACVVYWPNPLVWLAARHARLAQEQACDDRVLMAGVGAVAYAQELVEAARDLRRRGSFGGAAAMAEPSTLEKRVSGILGEGRERGRLRGSMAVWAAVCAAGVWAGCSQVTVREAAKPG